MPYDNYPDTSKCRKLISEIEMYVQQKHEFGAKKLTVILAEAENLLRVSLQKVKDSPVNETEKANEPDELDMIKKLRPEGKRTLWKSFDLEGYKDRIEGALISRFSGCTLGAAVEGWSVDRMEKWAKETGDEFPPVDYWSKSDTALKDRYEISKFKDYTRGNIDGVPADDDIIYTLLGLMLIERHGIDFTTEDSVKMWIEYLDWVWVDMEIALGNYKKGVIAKNIADDNPYSQMICAGIRCDPFGYIFPGQPERAAAAAYKDSYASHRRNGLYGGMFFAASISAAFAVDDPVEAVKIGLTEIPEKSKLAESIRWALKTGPSLKDYRDARKAVDERFGGMLVPHTINNACLTTFGLMLGGRDITKVISQTVAMGLDNDCSAATAGSIAGACAGKKNVPEHWYRDFNNKVHSYIKGHRYFYIDDLVERYAKQAKTAFDK